MLHAACPFLCITPTPQLKLNFSSSGNHPPAAGFLHIPTHAPHRFTSFWVIATWQHILLLVDSCLLCIPPPHSSNSSSGDRPHAASFLYIPTHALGHRYVAAHGAACRFLCHSTPWLNFDFLRSGNRPPATYLPKHYSPLG